ncbi:MAG: hypothetical protein LBS65_03575 [Desulfovibrio sp.]|jgi:hypothetical protein|nr:hypothetical protein [Desulfovibrio sp.]
MDFKLYYRPETEIFVTQNFMVAIKQTHNDIGEESIVAFPPDDVPSVLEAIANCGEEAKALKQRAEKKP